MNSCFLYIYIHITMSYLSVTDFILGANQWKEKGHFHRFHFPSLFKGIVALGITTSTATRTVEFKILWCHYQYGYQDWPYDGCHVAPPKYPTHETLEISRAVRSLDLPTGKGVWCLIVLSIGYTVNKSISLLNGA